MPTNQSSPWGGGKPRACSNTESPTNTSSTTAKTAKKKVMAAKVPLSQSSLDLSRRKDQAKSLSTKIASSTAPSVPMWEKGDGYKCDTYSQFTTTTTTAATVPDGSPKMPGQVKHNQSPNQVLVNGLKKASGSPTHTNATSPKKECQNGFTVQTSQPGNDGDVPLGLDSLLSLCHEDLFMKGQPPTLQQTNKFMPEAADCSSLPPVPPLCLTQCDHRGAAFDENTPSFESTQHRSTARETTTSRRIHSAKTTTKPNLTSTSNDQLLVRGVPPAMVVSPTNTKPQILAPLELKTQVQDSPSTLSTGRRISPTKVCPVQNGPVPSALGVSATAETQTTVQEANTVVSPGPAVAMVGSVTTQISEIQLNKPGPAACVSPLPPPPSPSPSPSLYPSSPSPSATPSPTESEEGLAGDTQMSGQEECAMQVDGLEEELPDELENACSDDDDSDCSSRNGASSTTSSALLSSVEDPMLLGAEDEREEKPALVPSLFPLIPPTLYFSTANEKVELLPAEQRRMLKWKMSAVTPNVVKHTINRSHFKVTKKSHDWLGCWGHHMKSPGFKAIGEHQKLNHFPGTFQIGRKDRLWRNLSKMKVRFGKQEFNFFPRTFVLPQDIKLLRRAWEDCGSREKWIIKPPASARGIGIQVIHKWSQMPRRRPLLVQKYLHKPYLISGNKFDLRIYVYVTSYDPLRVYIFSDGLVRFASCKYSSSLKTLSNKFMHLTNYSVNKKNSEYQSNSDDKACQGHKWALKALWRYLGSKGVNTTVIWSKIKDIVIKTIIASEPYVNSLLKMHLRTPYSCHELFGFDIMLDENLKPWILEVNISPSLHSNTALDVAVKGQMIRDLLNLAGFRIPQREDVVASCSSTSSSTSSLCGGNRERQKADLSSDEKVKRAFYLTQRYADQDFLSSVLDVLTPEDVRVLAEAEDELTRLGEFERIFPSPISSRYLRFFEVPRYLNILLDQWEHKFWTNRTKGISHLRSLCQRGVHLGTNDPAHLWSKCSYISRFETHRPDTMSDSRSRGVVVSHQHRSHQDDGDLDDGSDREVASVSSLPLSPSPGSSVSSSACASPIPSLAHCSLQFDSV